MGRPRKKNVTAEECALLYKNGVPVKKIASKLNCAESTVYTRLKEANVDMSDKRSQSRRRTRKQKAEQGRELPEFNSHEERLEYMHNHQRPELAKFIAEIVEGINERRRKRAES